MTTFLAGRVIFMPDGRVNDPERLGFDVEDAKAAEFNSGIRDQAVGHFIKKSLNNLTGKIAGKTVLFGNLSNQVGLDHD